MRDLRETGCFRRCLKVRRLKEVEWRRKRKYVSRFKDEPPILITGRMLNGCKEMSHDRSRNNTILHSLSTATRESFGAVPLSKEVSYR